MHPLLINYPKAVFYTGILYEEHINISIMCILSKISHKMTSMERGMEWKWQAYQEPFAKLMPALIWWYNHDVILCSDKIMTKEWVSKLKVAQDGICICNFYQHIFFFIFDQEHTERHYHNMVVLLSYFFLLFVLKSWPSSKFKLNRAV